MQGPAVLLQLGYIWRHVSAVKRPSSGQHIVILLRYSEIIIQRDPTVYIKISNITKFLVMIQIQSGPKKCIHSLLINIFGINLNEISVSG